MDDQHQAAIVDDKTTDDDDHHQAIIRRRGTTTATTNMSSFSTATEQRPLHEHANSSNSKSPRHQVLATMLRREKAGRDTAASHTRSNSQVMKVNEVWRKMVAEWYYRVIDELQCDRSLAYLAMDIADRYLAAVASPAADDAAYFCNDEKSYQVVAMTSFLLATKVTCVVEERSRRRQLGIQSLVKMSANPHCRDVTPDDVTTMAKSIVRTLSLRRPADSSGDPSASSTPPLTPSSFVKVLVSALHLPTSIEEDATYLVELSVCDARYVGASPSLLSLAAISHCLDVQQGRCGTAATDDDVDAVVDLFATHSMLDSTEEIRSEVQRLCLLLRSTYAQSAECYDRSDGAASAVVRRSDEASDERRIVPSTPSNKNGPHLILDDDVDRDQEHVRRTAECGAPTKKRAQPQPSSPCTIPRTRKRMRLHMPGAA